jgi:hypothetical protein
MKRDGATEDFDGMKLGASLWRVIRPAGGLARQAYDLAAAIEVYITRAGLSKVSTSAIFEMSIKVLRRVGFQHAGEALEVHRIWRCEHRRRLSVRQDDGRSIEWDKSWLAQWAARSWHISPVAARIIAGRLEDELLPVTPLELTRTEVVELLNDRMAQFGLADAVPVHQD